MTAKVVVTPAEEKPEEDTPVPVAAKGVTRASLEAKIAEVGVVSAFTALNREKAGDIKRMVSEEYPELDLGGKSPQKMTKRELLLILSDHYSE